MAIFSSFGILNEILEPSSVLNTVTSGIFGGLGIVISMGYMVTIIYAGSTLTSEAQLFNILVAKAVNKTPKNEQQRNDFVYFASQSRSRNLNIQNFLFVINWNVLVAVNSISFFFIGIWQS